MWFFLGEALTDGATQVVGCVSRTLCVSRWPSNFVGSSTEIA